MNSDRTTSSQEKPPPSVIADRYTVERLLGRGGMATVYLCTDAVTDQKVAVKILRGELGSSVIIERFQREIEFASELDHPQVPKVLDSGLFGDLPFYVMTYVEGESLRERLDRVKQLPVEEAVRIASAVLDPMTYAHRLGIVHRDIKPGNILLGTDTVYVLDFGIARAIVASAEDRLTSTGVAIGTPAYMSPEQALADKDLDARSDLYSLGCVLFEMIAGIPPFVGATPQSVMARRFASAAPPLRETRDGVPAHVEHAVAKALSRTPADRWQTAHEFAHALNNPRPSESIQHIALAQRSRKTKLGFLILATGIGAVALATVAAVKLMASPTERAEAALSRGEFSVARDELEPVVARSPGSARAHFLLARAMNLQGRPVAEWAPHIRIALEQRRDLQPADTSVANALGSLVVPQHNNPCKLFAENARAERSLSSRGVTAGLEYADCLASDDLVIPWPASPSGYAFRSSYALADSVYSDVLDRRADHPRLYAQAARRLERVLPIDKGTFRSGRADGDRRMFFRALPSLSRDSIAFVPYPVVQGEPWKGGETSEVDRAIGRSRERLRLVTARWAVIDSANPDSHASYARVLETIGLLDGGPASASAQIALARYASRGGSDVQSYLQQLKLGLDQVRLAIRLNRFRYAGLVADTILAIPVPPRLSDENADEIAVYRSSFASLRGRGNEVAKIGERFAGRYPARLPDGSVITLPPSIGGALIKLDILASFGGTRDSIVAVSQRIATDAAALLPSSYSKAVTGTILSRPLSLAAPVIGGSPLLNLGPQQDTYARALIAWSLNDRRSARVLLDSLDRLHSAYAPGEITMDVVFSEAWLKAQLGDTTAAIDQLDRALRGIAAALPNMVRNQELTAFFVRAMALRAELAFRRQDGDSSRLWAGSVLDLWGTGDDVVGSTVEMVRRIRR